MQPAKKPAIPEFRVKLAIELEPDGEGFHAYCHALKGLHVQGDTEQEAIAAFREAACAYIVSLIKHGDPLPEKSASPLFCRVRRSILISLKKLSGRAARYFSALWAA